MRAYTSTYLTACWLLGVSACTLYETEPEDEAPTLPDLRAPDAGPTRCELPGFWQVELGERDSCGPSGASASVVIFVDGRDGGENVFAVDKPETLDDCGPYEQQSRVVAEGCTIRAWSRASWCAAERPQCNEYELTLRVNGDEAEVEGTYRSCWCGSPAPYGTKVDALGRATRVQ
jgi:hypothetical protein